jgi:hypothetical protein
MSKIKTEASQIYKAIKKLHKRIDEIMINIAWENNGIYAICQENLICEEYNDQECSYYSSVTIDGKVIITEPYGERSEKLSDLAIEVKLAILQSILKEMEE